MVEMDEYKKKIRVVNDYDVDGVASGHILYSALKRCGADVSIRVPDRIKDGYGLNSFLVKTDAPHGCNYAPISQVYLFLGGKYVRKNFI